MKKRILSALLTSTLVMSMTACGGNAPSEAQSQTSENNSGTSAVTSESSTSSADTESSAPEATTSATSETTTTVPETPVVPEELPVLNVEPALVMNGSMAFKHDGKNYVYNITENELYETEYDVSEISVLKGCVAVVGDVSFYEFNDTDAFVVNLKTGEQYADVRPFNNNDWSGSYLTVGTLEESFSGNTVSSIGILNCKGEWVLPLSSDYAACKIDDIDKTKYVYQNGEFIAFIVGSGFIYDIANDRLVDYVSILSVTDDRILIFDNYDDTKGTHELYNYDISTGEKTYICESSYPFYKKTPTCHASTKDLDGAYKVFDQNYNLLEHDLSGYDIPDDEIRGANEDTIVFNSISEEGGIYTIILNKDGSYVCEPYKYDRQTEGVYNAYFSENKIILKYNKTNDRIIDRNTGEITNLDDSFEIVDYDTKNNLMLVKTNGAYYLADPEDPETFINPFERASN